MHSVTLFKGPLDSLSRIVFNLNYWRIVATQEKVARTCFVKVYMSNLMSVAEELVRTSSTGLPGITSAIVTISRVI